MTGSQSTSAISPLVGLIIIAGCMMALISMGVRSTFGLFVAGAPDAIGVSAADFGLALGWSGLVWAGLGGLGWLGMVWGGLLWLRWIGVDWNGLGSSKRLLRSFATDLRASRLGQTNVIIFSVRGMSLGAIIRN